MGYKKVAIQGIGLMGLLHILIKGLAVVKIAILARLLTPYDIGIYGISFLVLSLFETFSELGLGTFLIQLKSKMDSFIDSIFLVQILRGAILSLLIFLSAGLVSAFFNDNKLISIILILSAVPAIKALENPFIVLYQKELYFKKEFSIRLVAGLIDLVTAAIAAFYYRSITGVILGFLFSTLVYVVLSWLVIKKHPGLSYSKSKLLTILNFAKSISALGIVTYIAMRIDSFLVGKFAGIAVLGGYQFSQKISFEIMNDTSAIVGKVTFPVYSKITFDKERLRKAFLKSFSTVLILEGIFCLFILFFAEEIIFILGGDKWMSYVNFLRLFSVYGFLMASWGSIGSLFLSISKQANLVMLTIVRLMILVPLLYYSYLARSAEYIVVSLILSLVLIFPLTFYFTKKVIY